MCGSAARLPGQRPGQAAARLDSRAGGRNAPTAHGPRWQRRACSSSLRTRRRRPLLSWGHRARWADRTPTTPSRRSRRGLTRRGWLEHGCRLARWTPQRRCTRRCTGLRPSAWTPPHVPLAVRTQTPNRVRTTAARKWHRLQHPILSLPEQGRVVRGLNARPSRRARGQRPPTRHGARPTTAATTAVRHVRIWVEHARGGLQRDNLLVPVCHQRQADCEENAVGIGAGLWHFARSS
jgi:hypothetical protein